MNVPSEEQNDKYCERNDDVTQHSTGQRELQKYCGEAENGGVTREKHKSV